MKPVKSIAPLIPYIAVAVGLFCARSAWVTLLGFHTGLLLVLVIEKPDIPIVTLLKNNNMLLLIGGILLGASGGVTLYLTWPVYSISPNLPSYLASIGLTSTTWPAFITYFALVNPWIEETFWRSYLGDPSKKILLIDFFYAGYHLLILYGKTSWAWMLFSLLVLAAVGWIWRQVSRKSGGLLAAALSHMAADLTILLAIYRMNTV